MVPETTRWFGLAAAGHGTRAPRDPRDRRGIDPVRVDRSVLTVEREQDDAVVGTRRR